MRPFLSTACAASALALTMLTAACGAGVGSTAPGDGQAAPVSKAPELGAGEKVSIVFESYNFGQAGAWTDTFNELIGAFHKAHPDITVTAQKPQGNSANPATDTISSLQSQMSVGKPPDVVQLGFSDLDFTVNQLKALPLDDLVGKDVVQKNFDGAKYPFAERARTLGDWNGKTYGVPFVFSTPMLYFNSALFEQAGLDPAKPPATWAEVAEAAKAIKEKTGKDGAYVDCLTKAAKDWCFQALVRSNGGRVISEDRTKLTFAEPQVTEVVTAMQAMVKDGAMPNRTQMQAVEAFARGDLGMILESSALQGTFAKGAGEKWKLGAAAMPGFEGKPAVPTNSGAALFVFAKEPAKQRAAWELITFLTSEQAYTTIATKIGYLPLRTGLVDDPAALKPWADANPYLKPNLEQLARMEPWVSMPGPNYLQIRDGMMEAVESAVFQGADPASTLTAKQGELAKLLPGGRG
ncbi:multiple sugar transport system substrate-binding protein [Thermocatellispora tengchongensis]|uniref:Multiple sugar transport system substrate-binding protein n=1 Tax=Thermocatellispora tengchongensis TaxID=1073253 RepID=A0A840PI12_9ACTN|nr:ABC transporter substrate-binding protein [Thermocatellispora tengchongensis]MBB5139188.1 multiple sugar transport system substrate-binding protein [Thermocatellispora tengchongensis]